jgi:hypothetical protein
MVPLFPEKKNMIFNSPLNRNGSFDMKKNKIDNFSLKIIVLTSIDHLRSIDPIPA